MKSKIAIIIEREYLTRIKKRSFIIMTLLGPILMLLMMVAPALLMAFGGEDNQVIAVLDHTGIYHNALKDTKDYKFVVATQSIDEYRQKAEDIDISGVLEIRQDLREDPNAMTLFSFKTLPQGVENYINTQLSDFVSHQKLLSHNIENIDEIVRSSETTLSVNTYKVGEDGKEQLSSGAVSMLLGMTLSILVYMFISLYGSSVLQSVMEEKKSRIMEVMVSSVKPFDLMMGKIIGVGAVGLTQIFIWGILLLVISQVGQLFLLGNLADTSVATTANMPIGSFDLTNAVGTLVGLNYLEIFICFVLYFIGGFLLYASLFAALGSAVSSDEDAQGLMWPITILMLFSFYAGFACMNAPDSALAHVASYIPFSTPVVMMVRIPYGVSIWEEIISLIILYGSFITFTYIGAKIYRIGVLMYGKKPTFKEIIRWIKE